jgi:NADPH:quinone reductase-like Zn-dependent oxidoreductase
LLSFPLSALALTMAANAVRRVAQDQGARPALRGNLSAKGLKMIESMRAAVSACYGSPDVLEIREVPKPKPSAGEVLVKVRATTVNRTDCGMLEPHPFFIRATAGLFRPKLTVLGMDFAGTVEAVGTSVTTFKPGDHVFGMSPRTYGAHAEYLCVREDGQIANMPSDLPFGDAVVCEGAWYADTSLRWLELEPGQSILIYGASGAIGVAAAQLAKARGATVTAVVGTRHLELAASLGADRVIDYTREDFTQTGETFDAILDAVGKTTWFRCRKLLKPGARYASTDLGPWWQNLILSLWFSITGSRRVAIPFPQSNRGFVDGLRAHMENGELRAIVDRTFPLEAIAEAYRYVMKGQKTGIVVIDVGAED